MFEIEATYLRHDGGSKFYETVLIKDTRGPTMLIKRWGKIGEGPTGGGQIKIEIGTRAAVCEGRSKILDEKRRHRSGKGRYIDHPMGFGLHGLADPANVKPDTLAANLGHYAASHVRDRISEHFGLGANYDVDDIVKATGEDYVVEEAPQIDRGSHWGSW